MAKRPKPKPKRKKAKPGPREERLIITDARAALAKLFGARKPRD